MPRPAVLGAVAVVAALALAGCATPRAGSVPPGGSGPDSAALVTTKHPVTVLDDGDGAELCLGAMAASYPPQCGGPSLVGWDWSRYVGEFEDAAGVRWGSFILTGTYDADADAFTPIEVASGADYEWPQVDMTDFASPCPDPDGGWRVLDEAKATFEAMNATFELAARLDGYATAWMDQSPNPAARSGDSAGSETGMNDPLLTIVNVRVTGDPAVAEAELREVWGGMLCVTQATRTAAELQAIRTEMMASTPGVLSAGENGLAGTVDVTVVYDDGRLQARCDAEYGPGVVRITSALVPVG
ncbi:hypothetical protein [Microbacterium immunditiarum]|uniref:Septum formation-related domain-containing protein n=1 Tax=Microbacterium immunditiarum TaxID=337480 RepID=A0A7Y9KLM3_9MICO|nr:hypothetical protein [Microbacterium immunditiarum]NYE20408.1 hypothetical protein [Microbacterium immunditiarum]